MASTGVTVWSDWATSHLTTPDIDKEAAARGAQVASLLGAADEGDLLQAAMTAAVVPTAAAGYATAADCLAGMLAAGWEPPGIKSSPFVLNAGERLLARATVQALVWQAVPRKKGHVWVGGASPVGLALLAASAVGNAARTAHAAKEAAARWRPLGSNSVFCVTNQRVLRQANQQWNAFSLNEVTRLDVAGDHSGVIVRIRSKESTPFLYQMPNADVWYALMRHLVPESANKTIDAPPEALYSADGRWWWDGSQWNDVATNPPPRNQGLAGSPTRIA